MLSIRLLLAAVPIVVLLVSPGMAEGKQSRSTFYCPEKLSVTEEFVSPAPWSPLPGKASRNLDRMELLVGDLADDAVLVPDQNRSENGTSIDVWSLANTLEEFWIICHYRETGARLARKLPSGLQSCEAVYRVVGQNTRIGFDRLTCIGVH